MAGTAVAAGREGYLHPRYAESLAEFGEPRQLPRSGGWLLVRAIPGCADRDALAGYRHLFCDDWTSLAADLDDCRDLVSIVGVTEPFAPVDSGELRRCFPDLVRAYKRNYVIDGTNLTPSPHHRAKVRKALRRVNVVLEPDPAARLEEWCILYETLCARHGITGLGAFSRVAFRHQLTTPGCRLFSARVDGRSVAMMIWYATAGVAHYHLGASSTAGYRSSASYALIDAAIESFARDGVRFLNLGAAAGVEANENDGLTRFKSGWTRSTRESYLCGRIGDRDAYARLMPKRHVTRGDVEFFPTYRAGEHD